MKDLDRKWIHLINIILGVIIVPYSILEFVAVLKLADNNDYLLVPIGLLALWLILYLVQLKKMKTLLVMGAVFLNVFYLFFVIPQLLY
ncbi:hypothetical protein GLW07_14610 [Bacillus hwajinpoensis]|uniref:Uncharacterized protein n=1 Tax=Guptibacillus hwajinpoensis TaxID=208199 RepID=A0A845F1K9_9BACL|nr:MULTISPECIES: hypothetical protein [Bacillaceae]MYL64586.1 hypothetical protein [Pseudalkalibacillus hwajinpoensis]PFG12497.1 hypothetical protein ATG70_0681 [Bacillus sp. es.036]